MSVYRASQNFDGLEVGGVAGCKYDGLAKLICDDACRDSEIRQYVCEHNCSWWPVCLSVAVSTLEDCVLLGDLIFVVALPVAGDEEASDQADAAYVEVRGKEARGSCEFSATGAFTVRGDESSFGGIPSDDRLQF